MSFLLLQLLNDPQTCPVRDKHDKYYYLLLEKRTQSRFFDMLKNDDEKELRFKFFGDEVSEQCACPIRDCWKIVSKVPKGSCALLLKLDCVDEIYMKYERRRGR